MTTNEFDAVFNALRPLLARYAKRMTVVKDEADCYYLDSKKQTAPNGKAQFFGSVTIKKSFVSFYLMPVYCDPTLLEGMSAALARRMQGKSCFNFKAVDEALFSELKALVVRSAKGF